MAATALELAQRLKAAREACGLKQEDVAEHLEVSRSTIAQIELGRRRVSSLELERLAYVFGRDLREFLAASYQPEDALSALFRAQPEVAGEPDVQDSLRSCIALGRELSNLEELLGIDREVVPIAAFSFGAPTKRWEAIRQGEKAAEEERRRLELGASPAPDIAELLEIQGIRTGLADMPADISGFTLNDPKTGFFVVANKSHHFWRRRFSFAHEYCHVLADRARFGLVSRASDRDDLIEIRANAFAAAFLMPGAGVRQFLEGFGKGAPSRGYAKLYDESEAVAVEGRSEPGSQELQLYDVAQLAHYFNVSRVAALYRLLNLKLINESQFERLHGQEKGFGREVARLLALPEPDHNEERNWFRRRFLSLALEAYRRDKISAGKVQELAGMVDVPEQELGELLGEAGLLAKQDSDVLIPG